MTFLALVGAVALCRLAGGGWIGLIVVLPAFFVLLIVFTIPSLVIESTLHARSERLKDDAKSDQLDADS